jgi:hypothetical protein
MQMYFAASPLSNEWEKVRASLGGHEKLGART